MPEKLEQVKIEIELMASRQIINEELFDLLKDFRELAENRGFEVKV